MMAFGFTKTTRADRHTSHSKAQILQARLIALGKTPIRGAHLRLGNITVTQPHFYLPAQTAFTDLRHHPQELSTYKCLRSEWEFGAQDKIKNLLGRATGSERSRLTVLDVILVGP